MRDPNRIDDFCERLAKVWKEVPDWRFGQLIFNVTNGADCFYVEDKQYIEGIERYMEHLKGGNNEV